ncbi:MAG: hypothetical protein ACRD16_09570 [Thermoanaerobaculia bacterium]
MKTLRIAALLCLFGSASSLLASPAAPQGGLALVPPDSLAVAVVSLERLRASNVAPSLFHQADEITVDGKASAFLKDAGLDPKRDVDSVVFSLSAGAHDEARPLVAFEGRFDPVALAAATLSRGATRVDGAIPYLRLPASASSSGNGHGGEPGAVAFLSARVILAGSEPAILDALDLSSKGRNGLPAGGKLAEMVRKIDSRSSAWVVVDAARMRSLKEAASRDSVGAGPASAVYSALSSVSWIVFQADVSSGDVDVKATGLSSDEEARQNIEDVLRGMIAAWRMAVQDKHPELVAMLRKFRVSRDSEGVTISGKLPAELFKSAMR